MHKTLNVRTPEYRSSNFGYKSQRLRGKSRSFLRRGVPLRNDVIDSEAKKIKSEYVYTKMKASSQGGMRTPCTLPLDPPLQLVPPNVSCELFVGQVPTTSQFVQTLHRIAARTCPFVCADYKAVLIIPIFIGQRAYKKPTAS